MKASGLFPCRITDGFHFRTATAERPGDGDIAVHEDRERDTLLVSRSRSDTCRSELLADLVG
jgi:hypothetical protein